jgi:hypothetical protein
MPHMAENSSRQFVFNPNEVTVRSASANYIENKPEVAGLIFKYISVNI